MADDEDKNNFLNQAPTAIITKPQVSKKRDKTARGKASKQILAGLTANFGTINTGMNLGFSAVVLPQLQAHFSEIPITEDQASWIASLSAMSTPIGCILSGYLMDAIGRRFSLILSELPIILGWVIIATAQNVNMIYLGRLCTGLGSGMLGAPVRVYTCEVSQPHLRGILGALASVGISSGVLIQYIIGSATTWRVLAGVSTTVPVLALLGMLFLPESPNYLLTRNNRARAQSSLARLRGSTYNVDEEFQSMIAFKEKNKVEPLKKPNEIVRALLAPFSLKPFAILALYFILFQWCGVNAVTFYAVDIFKRSGASLDEYTATISLGIVRIIFTIAGCVLSRRCGRRPLTFVSAIGCGSTMIAFGTYMYYLQHWTSEGIKPIATWVPVACVLVFMMMCAIGYLVVPWLMIGEVYPTQVRGIVGGMTTCVAHLSVFSVVKLYPFAKSVLGEHGVFWMYGIISFLAIIFFYFFLPETKGHSLQEIEDYFCGRTKKLEKSRVVQKSLPELCPDIGWKPNL